MISLQAGVVEEKKRRENQKWGQESEIEVSRVAAGYLFPHRMVKRDAFPVLRIVFSIPVLISSNSNLKGTG